jgi:hypothetical protein
LTLCRADTSTSDSVAKRCVEAHERRLLHEAETEEVNTSEGTNVTRGSAIESRVTPVRWYGLAACATPWSRERQLIAGVETTGGAGTVERRFPLAGRETL